MENIKELAQSYLNSKNNVFSDEELVKYSTKIKKKFLNSIDIMSNSEIRKVADKYPQVLDTKEDEVHPLFFAALTNDLSKNRVIFNLLLDNGLKYIPQLNIEFKGVKRDSTIWDFCVQKDLDVSFCHFLMSIQNPEILNFKKYVGLSLISDSHKIFSFVSKMIDSNSLQEYFLNIYSKDYVTAYLVTDKIMKYRVGNFNNYKIDLSFKKDDQNYLKATAAALEKSPPSYVPEKKRQDDYEYSEICYERLELIKKLLKHLTINCNLDWHEKHDDGITSKKKIDNFFEYHIKYNLSQKHTDKLEIEEFFKEIDLHILDMNTTQKEDKTKKLKI